MHSRQNISYLVPRDPSIKCWSDRVKLSAPRSKNLLQLGTDEFEETMGDELKIYLRLKPSISVESPYTVLSSNSLQTEPPKESVTYRNVTNGVGNMIHKFTFTSILDQDTTQGKVFKTCAVNNLKKFLSGENYLLMAYGTTSAGKTYTMQGNVENPGVIPRALDFLFTSLKDSIIPLCRYAPYQYNELTVLSEEQLRRDLMQKNFILSLDLTKYQRYPDVMQTTFQSSSSSGFSESYENVTFKEMKSNLVEVESVELASDADRYSVWVSMIEIYNEQLYDLLDSTYEKGMKPKLEMKEDECGSTFVKNLRFVNVSTGHEAFQVLQFGRSNLHFAPTALNAHSSRSHCIFTVTLAKFLDYESSPQAVISRFSFCDLAGMERAKKTLNDKDRLVESKSINTSLSILVKCLTTIKENQNSKEKRMIPYRESKLTKLFRDALTGKEQFSLIVNVTTDPNLFDETFNVLKFSAIAKKIVPQNVFVRPRMMKVARRKSRFTQIVHSSRNSRNIDWDATIDSDAKVNEEISSNSSSSSEEVEELRDEIESLRAQLALEKQRCEQIEADLREELTSKFREMFQKQNENHRIRMENEKENFQEMQERKEKRLAHYYEMMWKMKDGKIEEVERKLEEAEEELELVRREKEALREQVQGLVKEKERALEALERARKADEEEGGDGELEKELRKQLAEANSKISHFKGLLEEAASDFQEAEENARFQRNETKVLEQQLAENLETLNDLENENAELQNLLSQKQITMETLEKANEELRREKEEAEKDLEIANAKVADWKSKMEEAERESKIALESLLVKFEHQNSVMKNLKDESERQACEIPQLREEIKRLQKEIENREKDMESFNENREAIFNNYEKELSKLKEENERLRKDIQSDPIEKTMKSDKAELGRLRESVKEKDEEINRLKAEVESFKKPETESVKKRDVTSSVRKTESSQMKESRENSPFVNGNRKNEEGEDCESGRTKRGENVDKLTKQVEEMSIQQQPEPRSTRKKVDLCEQTIHPSAIKTNRGRRKKEKEAAVESENEKENIPVKKGKCYKKLFTDNDFDELVDLKASPLQEVSRLRPRK